MIVIEKIRELRIKKGYSQEYMAKQLDMAQNNYGKLERGETKLTIERLEQIANILDVKMEVILDFGEDPRIRILDNFNERLKERSEEADRILKSNYLLHQIIILQRQIQKEALKGNGLVYLSFDFEGSQYFARFQPLKNKLNQDDIAKILLESHLENLETLENKDQVIDQNLRKNRPKNQ